MCNLSWTPHSNIEKDNSLNHSESCVSPKMGCLDLEGVYLDTRLASHSYLGVKLDSKLSWAKHITEITSKSSKVLGMVKRTLGPCKPEVKDTAYNMLVRPKLEYANTYLEPTQKLSNNSPRKNSALRCQICSKRS